MGKRELIVFSICACLLLVFVAHVILDTNLLNDVQSRDDTGSEGGSSSDNQTGDSGTSDTNSSTGDNDTSSAGSSTGDNDTSSAGSSTGDSNEQTGSGKDHEDAADYAWDSSEVIDIELNGNAITVNATGVATVDGSTVTITSAANYKITGTLNNGQIIVDTGDKETIRLILNGVDITCSNSAPIYIKDAKKVILVLQEGTENYVSDGTSYVLEEGTDEPNAAVFSKSDLTIYGEGALNVDANYNDGIATKDGLIIKSGTVIVNSVDDGIRGKDYIIVKGGKVTVNADGDGVKSDNDADAEEGCVTVEAGVMNVVCDGDAIQAATDVTVTGGKITLISGGGSNGFVYSGTSAKGIKANVSVTIDGGTFTIDSADDAVHSNDEMTINGGTFVIATGDDGFHADTSLEVNGGTIDITESYEGIESSTITINDGDIDITSSDDGINAAGGNDGSGMDQRGGRDRDIFTGSGDHYLYINGGYIVIDSGGDGLDINGGVEMTGGYVIINGPTSNMNGALDYYNSFKITGGVLMAVGSSGMAQAPSTSSTQYSVMLNFNSPISAGTIINIQTSTGTVAFSFKSTKQYQSVVFSSSALTKGVTYDVYVGGSASGTSYDGLYIGGTYTPGTQCATFTISSIVTRLGY
jgi:lipopolysaccharide export system protein LptC